MEVHSASFPPSSRKSVIYSKWFKTVCVKQETAEHYSEEAKNFCSPDVPFFMKHLVCRHETEFYIVCNIPYEEFLFA